MTKVKTRTGSGTSNSRDYRGVDHLPGHYSPIMETDAGPTQLTAPRSARRGRPPLVRVPEQQQYPRSRRKRSDAPSPVSVRRASLDLIGLTRDASELQPHEKRQKVAANQPILSVRQAQQTVDVHEPGERAHWATPATTAGPFRPSADSYLDRGGSPSPPSSPVFAYDEHLKHWSSCETKSLHRLVEQYGEDDWHSVASRMPGRSTQSCKLRWVRYKAEKQRQQQHTSSDVVAFPRGQSKGKERASDRFADPLFTLAAAATVIENLPPNMIITMAPPTAPALIEARAKDATMAPTMTPPTVSSMVSGVASNLIAASTKEMPKDVAIIPFSHPTMIQTVPLPPIENSGTSLAISPAKGPAANSDLVAVIEALPGPSTGPSIQKSLQSTGRQPDQGSRPKKHNAASGRWRAGEDKALMEGVNAYLASRGLEAQPPAHLPTEQELQLQKRQLQEEQNQRDATTILAAIQRQGANAYPITSVQNQPAYTMQQTHQYQHQHLQQQHLMLQRSQQSQQPQLLHQQQQLMLQLELHHYQQLQLHAQYQAQQRIQLLAQYQQPWSGSGLGPAEEAELFNSMVDLSYKASNGNGGLGNEAANAVESSPSSLGSLTAAVSAQDTSSNTSTRTGTTVVGSRIYRNMRSSHYVHNDDEYYSSASSYQSLSNTPISIASASSSNNASVNPSSGSGAKCDTDLAEALCEALSMAGEPRQFYSPQEVNGTSCEQSPHLVARSSSNDLTQPFVETRDDNQVPQQAHQDYYKEYQTQGYHLRYDGGFHTTAASPFLPATKVLANHQSTPAANPQAIVSEGIPTPSTGLLLEQQFMLPQSDNISATGSTLYFDNASQAMATYSVEHQNQASSNTLVFSHAASAIPFHRAQMNSQLATVESNHNGSNMPREPDRNEEMVNIEVKLPLMSNDTSQDMNALNQQQQNQEWHHHPLGPWLDADGGDNDKNGDTGLSDDDFIWNWDWTFLDGEKGGSLTPWTHTGLDYILGLEKLDPSLIPYPQAQAHSGTLCDSQPPLIADPGQPLTPFTMSSMHSTFDSTLLGFEPLALFDMFTPASFSSSHSLFVSDHPCLFHNNISSSSSSRSYNRLRDSKLSSSSNSSSSSSISSNSNCNTMNSVTNNTTDSIINNTITNINFNISTKDPKSNLEDMKEKEGAFDSRAPFFSFDDIMASNGFPGDIDLDGINFFTINNEFLNDSITKGIFSPLMNDIRDDAITAANTTSSGTSNTSTFTNKTNSITNTDNINTAMNTTTESNSQSTSTSTSSVPQFPTASARNKPQPHLGDRPPLKTREAYSLAISRAMTTCPWSYITQKAIPGRNGVQAQARWSEALDPRVKKEPWTAEEDTKLMEGVEKHQKCWIWIADGIPGRTQRQCRTRWVQITIKREREAAQAAVNALTEERKVREKMKGFEEEEGREEERKRLQGKWEVKAEENDGQDNDEDEDYVEEEEDEDIDDE